MRRALRHLGACLVRHWWSPLLAAGLVLFVGYMLWSAKVLVDSRQDREDVADRRRIEGRGLLYGGCLEDNRQNLRDDRSYQNLAVLTLQNPENEPERISRALDALRDGLNLADCETVLTGLSPRAAAEAKERAEEVPRLPLPPPTVPGYVPAE